jgi:hypothetical protein
VAYLGLREQALLAASTREVRATRGDCSST